MNIQHIKQHLISKSPRDINSLENYIKLIESENCDKNIEGEDHHVLPKCLFPEYKDFYENPWNNKRLSHENHLMAHYYLALAFDNFGLRLAFSRMANHYERIKELDPNVLDKIMKDYAKIRKDLNKYQRECKLYNNGIEDMYIHQSESVPDGWNLGSIRKGNIIINNGKRHKSHNPNKPIPIGWDIGVVKSTRMKRGTTFITNGIIDKRHHKDDPLPEGFIFGKSSIPNANKIMFNDGYHNKLFIKGQQPEGWSQGSIGRIKKFFYTNGLEEKMFKPGDEPEGWTIGRAKREYYTNGIEDRFVLPNKIPEGWYKGRTNKQSSPAKGYIHITNGTDNKMIPKENIIPDGWKLGRTLKKKTPNLLDII